MGRITHNEFQDLVRSCSRAWHLELRDTYNVEAEDEPFERFLQGIPDTYDWLMEWLDFVSDATRGGTTIERLRVVNLPHTDYTRWGLVVAPRNISAGETIRYLPRHLAAGIDFPQEDCWLLDDDVLILSIFSDDGRTGGFAAETDPDLVATYRRVRDEAWPRAIDYRRYAA